MYQLKKFKKDTQRMKYCIVTRTKKIGKIQLKIRMNNSEQNQQGKILLGIERRRVAWDMCSFQEGGL